MSKAKETKVIIPADLALDQEVIDRIAARVPGNDSPARKVVLVGIGLLEGMAAGGIMLYDEAVRKIAVALGHEPDGQDEVVSAVEEGAGRVGGKLRVSIDFDPADEPRLNEMAEFNGIPVSQVIQNIVDQARDNGWLWTESGNSPERVLMSKQDKAELTALLGDFKNGTELAALVKEGLNSASLFTEK